MNDLEKYAAKRKLAGRLGAAIGATAGGLLMPVTPTTSMIGAAIGASKGHKLRSALGAGLGHTSAAMALQGGVPFGASSLCLISVKSLPLDLIIEALDLLTINFLVSLPTSSKVLSM